MLKVIILITITISFADCVTWRSSSTTGSVNLSGAIQGGYYNGHRYYVIKASHRSAVFPGKFSPNEHFATFAADGREVYTQSMQVRF